MTASWLPPVLESFRERFVELYGEDRADICIERLRMLIERYGVGGGRKPAPWRPDETVSVLITYGDSIVKEGEAPLQTLRRFLSERLKGLFGAVHILPFFPYSSDDGFSVSDYRQVREDLGGWAEVAAIGEDFHLGVDLVLNHCSSESAWFRDWANGIAPERGYFVEAAPDSDVASVTRPRTHPLLTPVMTRDGERHVWTTFSADQVDLDFSNPDVLFEFLDILLLYVAKGARIVRLDAIAYLWKRLGTTCIHLPETHAVVKLLRAFLELVAPNVLLLTETNVPHEENVSYFGDGDEAHMVYQFSLPPLLLYSLHRESATVLREWLAGLSPPPPGCSFLNFTASHDGVGVRPLEGLVPDAEVEWLAERVRQRGGQVSARTGPDGRERPYELNITYFDALGDPGSKGSELHVARFLCSQTVALALQGIPAVYLHSLTATPNDYAGVERTGRARSINRRRWSSKELRAQLRDAETPTARVFSEYTRLLAIRREYPAFHPQGSQHVLDLGDEVLAFERRSPHGSEVVLALANLTSRDVGVPLAGSVADAAGDGVHDLLRDDRPLDAAGVVELGPFECAWIRARTDGV